MLALSLYLIGCVTATIALYSAFEPDNVNVFTPMGYLTIALWPISTPIVMGIYFYYAIKEDMKGE